MPARTSDAVLLLFPELSYLLDISVTALNLKMISDIITY